MGIMDSPLAGRVLFVEGAPRSGTTWITALLATHPDIAGTGNESHLFDNGLNTLFDNHESPSGVSLSAFVGDQELVDLVRDLCDGIFLRMRERAKPEAAFVVEKTPLFSAAARQVIERKLRCYPDAWYLHIVRDEQATAQSSIRMPFASDLSEDEGREGIREAVKAIREVTAGHPRYLEVQHGDLRADPGRGVGEILQWLGVDASEAVLERVRALSGEHFSRYQPPLASTGSSTSRSFPPLIARARGAATIFRRSLRAIAGEPAPDPPSEAFQSADSLMVAARDGDAEALRDLTAPDFRIEFRTGTWDLIARGDDARKELLDFGQRVLGHFFVTVEWTPADGRPYSTFLLHALDGDATRIDVSLHAFPEGDRVGRLTVLSAGTLEGRPFDTWSAGPGSGMARTA